jgi:hypothetical protein
MGEATVIIELENYSPYGTRTRGKIAVEEADDCNDINLGINADDENFTVLITTREARALAAMLIHYASEQERKWRL